MHDEDMIINRFIQIALALNASVTKRLGTSPLLSSATYSYDVPLMSWNWKEIGQRIEELEPTLELLSPLRSAYLKDLLAAFGLMVREGKGERISYAERVSTYLQVPGERIPTGTIVSLRSQLRSLFVEAGYPDDLAVALPSWRSRQLIRGTAFIEYARSWLEHARNTMTTSVLPIPNQLEVTICLLSGYPNYAASRYQRNYKGQVIFSDDITWERAALKHNICHEAFPGHQAFASLREHYFKAGALPIEGTIYFGNTPMSPIVEGMAECGTEILGLLETLDDHIFNVYNRLCFAVSTNIAFDCNEEGMEEDEAVEQLMNLLHVPPAWAIQRYRIVTHPLWATSFPHYWYGRELIAETYARMQHNLETFYHMVYAEPHTVSTLQHSIQLHVNKNTGDRPSYS